VLVDHARARDAEKRGGGQLCLQLNEDLGRDTETVLEFGPLHEAIEKLRGRNQRHAEVVLLRVFSGMTMDDIANHLGVSKRTVEADWTFARVWLRRELAGPLGLEGSAP
jgi:RNA polymerase sigma factor (TIGR02999 family)